MVRGELYVDRDERGMRQSQTSTSKKKPPARPAKTAKPPARTGKKPKEKKEKSIPESQRETKTDFPKFIR